jgi:hypothetical protein
MVLNEDGATHANGFFVGQFGLGARMDSGDVQFIGLETME